MFGFVWRHGGKDGNDLGVRGRGSKLYACVRRRLLLLVRSRTKENKSEIIYKFYRREEGGNVCVPLSFYARKFSFKKMR